MNKCLKCGKYCVKNMEYCGTCNAKMVTQKLYKGVYAEVNATKKEAKPKQPIMTDAEQKKIDDAIRMRFGLPVTSGRVIEKGSEEFARIEKELIEREAKRGKKYPESESRVSRYAE